MALIPLLLGDYDRPSRLSDQHFGLQLLEDDFMEPIVNSLRRRNYYRPWKSALAKADSGSTVQHDKDKFQVSLDVQQFAPDEITVKTVDKSIVVEGKHEEKEDEHGFVSRQFVRKYSIPKGHDPKDVVSSLSSDGVLTITAPKRKADGELERVVPITQTGPTKAKPVENGVKKPRLK